VAFDIEWPMPLYWTIESRTKLVTLVAEGEVFLEDAVACLAAVHGASATPYRKLFDGRRGVSSMTEQELLMVGAEIRAHHRHSKVGALAVVAPPEQTGAFGRLLGTLAMADRPMRLFDELAPAQRWLDEQP
jgi:hypothetical protein